MGNRESVFCKLPQEGQDLRSWQRHPKMPKYKWLQTPKPFKKLFWLTLPPVDPVEVNYVFSSFFFRLLASLFHHASVLVFVCYLLHMFSVGLSPLGLFLCFLRMFVSCCIFCIIHLWVCIFLGYLMFSQECFVWFVYMCHFFSFAMCLSTCAWILQNPY